MQCRSKRRFLRLVVAAEVVVVMSILFLPRMGEHFSEMW
jgi:hypothetical protein